MWSYIVIPGLIVLVFSSCEPSGADGLDGAIEDSSSPSPGDGDDPLGDDDATGDDDGATPKPEPTPIPEDAFGRLALGFQLDSDWSGWMQEPPVGYFYGAVFRAGDVSGTGPDGEAEILESIETWVDLVVPEGADPEEWTTDVLYLTGPLPVGDVYVLGFLDSDGNADPENTYPDTGDMATNPDLNNIHTVYRDVDTEVVVYLNIGMS